MFFNLTLQVLKIIDPPDQIPDFPLHPKTTGTLTLLHAADTGAPVILYCGGGVPDIETYFDCYEFDGGSWELSGIYLPPGLTTGGYGGKLFALDTAESRLWLQAGTAAGFSFVLDRATLEWAEGPSAFLAPDCCSAQGQRRKKMQALAGLLDFCNIQLVVIEPFNDSFC